MAILEGGTALGGLVADGLVVSFLFRVTVSTARGAEGFHGADDFHGFFEDVLGPLFRALVASIWSWGPFFALVIWRRGGFFTVDDPLQLNEISIVPVLFLLAGTLLFPMALLARALKSPLVRRGALRGPAPAQAEARRAGAPQTGSPAPY